MRIAIDARKMVVQRTGIGNYLLGLLQALSGLDTRNEYLLYIHQPFEDAAALGLGPNFRFRVLKAPTLAWKNIRLPLALNLDGVDVFHSAAYTVPFVKVCKTVVTIHDVIFDTMPIDFSTRERLLLRKLTRKAAFSADKVLAVSAATKSDVCRLYHVPEDKVVVTLEAIAAHIQRVTDADLIRQVKAKHGIADEYVLYVGTMFRRRNVPALIEAFAAMRDVRPGIQLALVSSRDWDFAHVAQMVEQRGLGSSVLLTGYADDADMAALYSGASVFVYPSSYEGFGLPVLEAMACGTPVITGNNSSLKEISGDAAILVDPTSVPVLAESLRKVLSDRRLREDMARKGLEQVRKFSWDTAARQTLEVYQQLYDEGR